MKGNERQQVKALVISNMYPSAARPSFGVFVQRITNQMESNGVTVDRTVRVEGGNKIASYASFYLKSFFSVLFSTHDFIYLHFPSHSYPGVWLALSLRNIPLVVNLHGADVAPDRTGSLRRQLVRIVTGMSLRRAALVVVPSPYFRELVASEFPQVSKKIEVSPSGGVDTTTLSYKPLQTSGYRSFLFLGRLIKGKGPHLVIEAAKLLEQSRPDLSYNLVFAGEGPERASLEEQARTLTQARIKFLGNVSPADVPSTIGTCHALVFPSYRKGESLGLVALEAMACGRPVIAAKSGAMDGIIDDSSVGWLFNPNDSRELAHAMQSLLDSSSKDLEAMSLAARKAAEKYSGNLVGERLVSLLRKTIMHKGTHGKVI